MVLFKLQIILIVFSITSLVVIINMISKYKLELKYSLLWLFLNTILIVLSIFPYLLNIISSILGIELPVNTLFFFGISSTLLIMFSLTVGLSRSSNKVKELSQEIGMLKHQVSELYSELERNKQKEKF